MNKEIQKLENKQSIIQERINNLKEKERLEKIVPFLKTLVGTCYKYTSYDSVLKQHYNSFKKCIGFGEDKNKYVTLIMEEFTIESDGRLDFRVYGDWISQNLDNPLKRYGWENMKEDDYQLARAEFFKESSVLIKIKKYIKKS